jgi:hypothetical protein
MLSKENLIERKFKTNPINSINIDNTLIDFIFQFCVVRNVKYLLHRLVI